MSKKVISSAYPAHDTVFNVANVIAKNATLSGLSNKVAVIEVSGKGKDRKYTYAQLNLRVNRLANALRRAGVRKSDRVFVLLPNRIEIIDALLACLKIGAIYTPANFRLSAEEIRFMIKDMDAKILLYDYEYAAMVSEVISKDIYPLALVEVGGARVKGSTSYGAFVKGASNKEPGIRSKPGEIAVIIFTAGTTGRPKGVKLSHKCMFFSNLANGTSVALNRDDVY